jgi:hypothetical protein
MTAEKRPFIIEIDHMKAGYWGVMLARSEEEIREKWPEVNIVYDHPKWMSDDRYERYLSHPYDIDDDDPHGILNIIVRSRSGR